jgi:hypothetical protein
MDTPGRPKVLGIFYISTVKLTFASICGWERRSGAAACMRGRFHCVAYDHRITPAQIFPGAVGMQAASPAIPPSCRPCYPGRF